MTDKLPDVNRMLGKIRSGKTGRDEVITFLYNDRKLRNSFKKMIRTQGWPKNVFDSIFTDAIITFANSVIRRKDFILTTDLHNYILVIAKRSYKSGLKKGLRTNPIEEEGSLELTDGDEALSLMIDQEKKGLIQLVLGRLGRNCREVLMYWASGYNMKEIAIYMNYKSDMMARKKKSKCFKELVGLINENPKLENMLR